MEELSQLSAKKDIVVPRISSSRFGNERKREGGERCESSQIKGGKKALSERKEGKTLSLQVREREKGKESCVLRWEEEKKRGAFFRERGEILFLFLKKKRPARREEKERGGRIGLPESDGRRKEKKIRADQT